MVVYSEARGRGETKRLPRGPQECPKRPPRGPRVAKKAVLGYAWLCLAVLGCVWLCLAVLAFCINMKRHFPFACCSGFRVIRGHFSCFLCVFFIRFFSLIFVDCFGVPFGVPKSVPNRPKFSPRRLLKRYVLRKWLFTKPFNNQWQINKNEPKIGPQTA